MEKQPLVSVAIPTYHRPRYLKLALDSALAQTYRSIEVIVQDNGSPVDPEPIVLAAGDPRIRYYRNERNQGLFVNITTVMRRATGTYIAWLDDDDLWKPNFLERLVPALERDPGCILAFSDHDLIDAEGLPLVAATERLRRFHGRHRLAPGYHEGDVERFALIFRSIKPFSGSVMRRAALDWTAIPPCFFENCDLYIAYALAVSGKRCYYDPERLFQVRLHPGMSSNQSNAHARGKLMLNEAGLEFWELIRSDPRVRYKSYYALRRGRCAAALVFYRATLGEWAEAVRTFLRAVRSGALGPHILFYHMFYAVSLGMRGLRWKRP